MSKIWRLKKFNVRYFQWYVSMTMQSYHPKAFELPGNCISFWGTCFPNMIWTEKHRHTKAQKFYFLVHNFVNTANLKTLERKELVNTRKKLD